MRLFILVYAISSYGVSFVASLYAIGFVGDFVVPNTIDAGATAPLTEALVVNLALLGLPSGRRRGSKARIRCDDGYEEDGRRRDHGGAARLRLRLWVGAATAGWERRNIAACTHGAPGEPIPSSASRMPGQPVIG